MGGFLVEKGTPGFDARVMTGKTALRAVWQADITLDGVRVPDANRLPGCERFADVARVLTVTRYTVAWRALGVALAAFEHALAYASERRQFGHRLVTYQLVQDKLSRMAAEITAMQLLCLRLSALQEEGRLTSAMASLAKMNHAAKARQVVADARDILGGNGILLENHVARHHADMEAVFTFEGTDSIQSLIVGRALTGRVGDRAAARVLTFGAISGVHRSGSGTSCLLGPGCVQPCTHAQVRPQDAVRPPGGRARAGRPVRRRGAAQRAGGLAGRPLAAPAPGCLARSALSPNRPRPAPRSSPSRAPDAGPVSFDRPGDRVATVGGCGIGGAPRHLGR